MLLLLASVRSGRQDVEIRASLGGFGGFMRGDIGTPSLCRLNGKDHERPFAEPFPGALITPAHASGDIFVRAGNA